MMLKGSFLWYLGVYKMHGDGGGFAWRPVLLHIYSTHSAHYVSPSCGDEDAD